MGSMLTSRLRATYDAAVKKCVEKYVADLRKCKLVNELADPELTAMYAESQNAKRERHDSFVTLTAHE